MNDDWMNAFLALTTLQHYEVLKPDLTNPTLKKLSQPVYDPKPLASLLRSDVPIPAEARDLLAELLDPSSGNPFGVVLIPKETKTIRQLEREYKAKMPMASTYRGLRKSGLTVEEAAEKTGESFKVDESTVRRHDKDIRELEAFLQPKKP